MGPFADIARLLEFKPRKKGGYPDWVYDSIRKSIQRIAGARATSKGSWTTRTKDDQGATTKRFVEDGPFAIYARPFFAHQKLPDGTIAETNYLELGSWYLQSLNDRFVRPLDFTYYKSFKTNTGPRLYELLGTNFYGWRRGQSPRRYRYSTLCQLLPTSQQRYLAKAKQMLDPGHKELKSTGFLAAYSWEPIDGETGDWMLYYWPGPRALDEITGKTFDTPKRQQAPQLPTAEIEPETLELYTQTTLPDHLDPQLADVWSRVLGRLRDKLPGSAFSTYLADTVLIGLTDRKATVAILNQASAVSLNRRYYGHIVRELAWAINIDRDAVEIEFVVAQTPRDAVEPTAG